MILRLVVFFLISVLFSKRITSAHENGLFEQIERALIDGTMTNELGEEMLFGEDYPKEIEINCPVNTIYKIHLCSIKLIVFIRSGSSFTYRYYT